MKLMLSRQSVKRVPSLHQQAGAAIIEFAVVALIFLTLLIGIMELGRWMFTLGAANEATRWGARLAVVCGSSQTAIQTHIGVMIRSGGTLSVDYPPSGCTTDCVVTVRLAGAKFKPLIPLFPQSSDRDGWLMPDFITTLPREAMGSEGSTSATNDVCPA